MSHFCKGLCLPLSGAVSPESAPEFYSHVRPEESQCWGLYLNTHTKQADVQIHRSGSCAVPAMKETPLKEGDTSERRRRAAAHPEHHMAPGLWN